MFSLEVEIFCWEIQDLLKGKENIEVLPRVIGLAIKRYRFCE
jgi:hypothetical protein